MRILFHHRIASRDGQYVHMEELIEALTARGAEVRVVGPARLAESRFGDDAGAIAWAKRLLPRALYEVLEFGYNLVAYRRLRKACRDWRPDVIYERYNLYMLAGVRVSRALGIPLLMEVNAPLREERQKHAGLALPRFAAWAEAKAWRGADRVLPVTGVLAGYVRRAGVPEARIVVIPNGINRRRFAAAPARDEAKRRLGLEGRTVLGFTGFIRHWHRLDRVVDLLADQPAEQGLHLLVVGDGNDRADLEAYAARRGVSDRLTVTGIVGRDEVAAYIAGFDVALQPGVTPYASPLKLFEYMALGAAIVAPDMPNIREVLTDGQDALLFDPGDPAGFAASIRRLCADRDLRERLGAGAAATIGRRGYFWSANAERVQTLAEAILPSPVYGRGRAPAAKPRGG